MPFRLKRLLFTFTGFPGEAIGTQFESSHFICLAFSVCEVVRFLL